MTNGHTNIPRMYR